ncbi:MULTISPECIES: tRNA uracil 4-sulfurtransferase ThiI [Tepidibacillus]|uniref:Probable tRNA sulfurtransferase n=1 Tax=Tepidibacillus decaturensis TaxID=1413211 RepID=A0A135L2R7_9BACI|nr:MULTISPECIES: tRNA uracil 4-sulfurtransferase ThiI [Tepidibacillus]KXG43240.1 thiamine biosynthesis protein ThiI [Tepidibacillus decaturensis]GBF10982.1 putative tRNA sulfurtransferase [Tepidibacillus sp. HK-1]
MHYDYILVRYGEIALKGKNRYRFEDRLVQNIRNVLKDLPQAKVTKTFGRIYVELNGSPYEIVIERLKKVFGLISFSPVKKTGLELEQIKTTALEVIEQLKPIPKTFKVETKRPYKLFPLNSPEVTNEVGGHLLRNIQGLKVDVHHPDTTVMVEIREEGVFIYSEVIKGIGGMPAGTSGKGIALLSGGIDSPVSSWYAMKRGLLVEGIHFHTYPLTTEESIQKVIDLAQALSYFSGQFKVHMVPFLEIQKEIKTYAPESHNITMMRRFFFRIAERLAERRGALSLITGESLGQVASQTLESMYAINQVVHTPIIRPLITMDKLDIIEVAQKIGTYEASIRPFEDCCSLFVPRNPATKPSIKIAEKAESYMDIDQLVEDALANTRVITVTPHSKIKAKDLLFTDIKVFTK